MVMMGMELFNKYNKILDPLRQACGSSVVVVGRGEGIDYKLNIHLYCY